MLTLAVCGCSGSADMRERWHSPLTFLYTFLLYVLNSKESRPRVDLPYESTDFKLRDYE